MVNYYLDTSAILKHYINEPGSGWVSALISSAALLTASQLVIVETAALAEGMLVDNPNNHP